MFSIASDLPFTRRLAARPRRSLVVAAGVFAATGLFDLLARPYLGDHHSHATSVYTFTALLIPFALVMLWALLDLRSSARADNRLATAGLWTAAFGLILFLPCAIASLATADPRALGPLYMVAMLLSLVGIGLLSFALTRTQALPRWAAVALPAAWLIGGPVGEGGIFRGAALILAAVAIAMATTATARPTK